MPITSRAQRNADRLSPGGKRPVLAIVAFFANFLFVALPFALYADTPIPIRVAAPCIIAALSCSILFMQLLIGDIRTVKWLLLGTAACLGVSVGPQWYLVAFFTGGTVLCLFLIDRLIGNFVPLVDISKCQRV